MKRKNALVLFSVLVVVLLVLDRVTKNIAIEVLTAEGPQPFIPGVLDFSLVYNTGGAFGMFEGGGVFFVGIAVIALVVIVAYLIKAKELFLPVVVSLGMIASGAIGNAYDRAVDGAVPDFLHTLFIQFPVFNVADICLTVGEGILIIAVVYLWFGPKSREQQGESKEQEGENKELQDESLEQQAQQTENE